MEMIEKNTSDVETLIKFIGFTITQENNNKIIYSFKCHDGTWEIVKYKNLTGGIFNLSANFKYNYLGGGTIMYGNMTPKHLNNFLFEKFKKEIRENNINTILN